MTNFKKSTKDVYLKASSKFMRRLAVKIKFLSLMLKCLTNKEKITSLKETECQPEEHHGLTKES